MDMLFAYLRTDCLAGFYTDFPIDDRSRSCRPSVVCVLPRGHHLSSQKVITPDMLRREDILSSSNMGPENWIHTLRAVLEKHGIEYRPAIESIHSHLLCDFVANGMDVVLAPPVPLHDDDNNVLVKPFEPAINSPLLVVMPVGRPPAQAATSLVRSMQNVLGTVRVTS